MFINTKHLPAFPDVIQYQYLIGKLGTIKTIMKFKPSHLVLSYPRLVSGLPFPVSRLPGLYLQANTFRIVPVVFGTEEKIEMHGAGGRKHG